MSSKLRMAIFKVIDILVIFTMVFASPMSMTAVAMSQETGPTLAADKSQYNVGESVHVTGSGFAAGDYVLAANGVEWGSITASELGTFETNSPALDAEGTYEIRAYAAGWSGDWNEAPLTSTAFIVTTPTPSTEAPMEAPTEEPTAEPTSEPTEEPTVEPTEDATEVSTEEPAAEPTTEPTEEPTTAPTLEPAPLPVPTIQSDKEDYTPGELVTLTGTDWQGDTQVRIFVNDNIGQTWFRDVIVDVAPDGTIIDTFNLPNWFVAAYIVSASGQQTGRVVTTSFTDAPGLTLVKSASPLTYTAAGQVINFSYQLTNTGTTVLNGPFTVTDNKVPSVTCPATATLAIGAFITCTGTYTITAADMSLGYAVNTATASSSNPGATTSNPDVRIVSLPMTCRNDSDGANDEPGQKDLTRECIAESSIDPLVISWNWDVISMTGNNSADGCALFDTDNDGLANYSLCASWQGQRVMQSGYPRLYSCNDSRSDRCPGAVPVTISNGSTCALELASDDPFSAGDSFPQDAKAVCSINLDDVGGATQSTLLDVCSYPSVQPNSDPSDCVVISQDKGNLNVIKNVVPDDASTNWNISVSGSTPFTDTLTGDDSTGIRAVNAGSYTITETAGANTDLANYTTTWACTVNGSPSSSGTGTSITTNVASGAVVVCTFTNTRKTGSLQILKDVVPDAPSTNWNFAVTGPTSYNCSIAGDGFCTTQTVSTGSYSITETAGSGTTLSDYGTSYTCTVNGSAGPSGSGTSLGGLTINQNDAVVCTFTNTQQQATLIVKKVLTNDNGGTKGFTDFSFVVNGGSPMTFDTDGQNEVSVSPGSYTVTEPAVTGYTTTYNNCTNVSIPPGGTATCTITNDDQPGTLIVKKIVTNDNGGTKAVTDFSFQINGGTAVAFEADGQNDVIVNAGNYTVTEPSVPGYTTTYDNCSNVVVANGGTQTCTITNNDNAASLTVIKHVITDNGGSAVAANFTMNVTATNPSDDSFPGAEAPGTTITLDAGSYSVTETGPSGYTATYSADCSGTIAAGESKTCTITNDDQPGTLIVNKVVINNNGGTLDAEDFSFTVNGDPAVPFEADGQNNLTVNAGTYTVTEPAVSGYSTSYDNCSDLVIPNGGTATCTITNDDQPAHLTLVKVVSNDNGGMAVATDFTLSANGPTPISGAGGANSDVDAGTYTLSETSQPGYTASAWTCVGGTQNGSEITLANGESATCTITNHDTAPSLTLIKQVVNDNGGTAETTDFTLSADGPTPISGAGGATSDASFQAGTYTLSETNVPGYSASTWSCIGGTQNGSEITLELGESATCTITNDDNAPSLTLVKQVINDNGGTALTTDFTLSADGPTPISGAGGASSHSTFHAGTYDLSETAVPGYTASDWICVGGTQADEDTVTVELGEEVTCTITNDDNAPSLTLVKIVVNDNGGTALTTDFTLSADGPTPISGAGGASSDSTFDAGIYTLSETGPNGYTASAWSCVGGTQNGSDITLALGESATCTITNDDNAPSLTLVKVVVNDNGGSATAADFTLTATGPTGFSGAGPSVSNGASFDAGTYDLSETGPAGYSASDWVCSGGTQDDTDTITLGLGESATCTITNDDNAPSLTLVKVVTNNDGGDAVESDWTLTATGPTGFSGPGPSVSSDASFEAGTYTLSESGPDGYTASAWSCVGGTQNGSDITLDLGESATCTITNDDVAPTLKLVKEVNNDNGGNADPDDWTLSATAAAPDDGRNFTTPGGSGIFQTIFANVPYDLAESMVPGYTAGAWSCDGGALVGSTITLEEGETGVTCTITNDDSAPMLTLIKIVVNNDGGTASVADFPLFINGNPTASGQSNTLSANTPYTASETTQPGYAASAWGGDCNADGTITLDEGQNATCTITNDDIAPTLKLVKNVTNNNGGNAVADDWTLSATAAAPFDGRNFSNAGGSGDFEIVFANKGYDLSETTLPGYTAGAWSCDGGALSGSNITLAEGENVTCTITNDDIAPQLRLVKVVINDDGGNAAVANFPLFIDGAPVTSGTFVEVTANAVHTASETTQPGYTASAWGGDCAADGTITLNEGDVKTCTITNDDVAPTLKLVKVVVNDDNGDAVADDWTLSAEAAAPFNGRNFSNLGGSGDFEMVFANQGYDLSETTVPGYTAGAWSCDGGTLVSSTVTLDEGETGVTCTITNDDVAPTLTLIKTVINDNGGNAQPDDFNLTIGGNLATSGTAYTLDANTAYAINETLLPGYTFVEITGDAECPAVLGGTVTLDEGQNVTCAITNDDVAPTLTLIKNVINDSGGSAQPDDFNLTIGGTPATSGTAYPLQSNTPYAINETLVAGYSFVSIIGDAECPSVLGGTVTLDEGENITCAITNDDQPATLIIIKHVVNDNGGTADAEDFTLDSGGTDDSPDNFSGEEAPGTTVTLDAGAYNVTETGPGGYSASFSADCSGTIANGETKTCTVTNDDIQPQLLVIKHVINDSGGNADAADFLMEVSGTNVNPVNFPGSELGTNVALDAGSYSVAEAAVPGYAPTFSADCTGTIAVGETKTCTITNDDISPMLTVVKVLLPGDDTGLFNLQIDGITQAADVGDNGTTGPVAVDAGSHTVGETAGTGTRLSDYVTTIGGDCAPDGTVSLALAENKTCTIPNVRRGSIVIVKNALGGDGTFNFTSSSLGNFSITTASGTGSTTFSSLDPANTYAAAETVPAGWELNSATCDSGETIDSIDLEPGETVTCTFENEKAGSIVIVKNTVGGDGTFNFTSNTLGNFSLTTSSGTASTTFSNLDVDLTYDATETVPAGWDLTSATCDSGETLDSIDLEPGETVTCTFTNTRRGHIIVDKVTLPSGDTQNFAFTTMGSGYTGFNLTDAAAPNDQELVPGTYSVTETVPAGWDLTGLSCTDPSGAPAIAGNKATINLAAGETVHCTFTNTKRGSIQIVKDAVPNDAQDFAFTTTGTGISAFNLDDDSNATLPNSKTFSNLIPGSYSVTEGAVAGWDLTGLTCNDANGTTSLGTRTASITLDPGENVTCSFTNTKRGTIIVEKQTNPNGAPGNFTFTGTAAGTIADNGIITVTNLVPGTYTSTEADPSASLFALTSIVCNDGSSASPSTGNLATRTATFRLDPGETVRCVFTNSKDFHAGTIGFWKNWRNHYTSSQFQLLINYLKTNNPKIYNKDLILNNTDDLTIAKHDAIMNVGSSTPREQMILAQFTALKFNLAITQLQGTSGLVQKNDNLCTAGVVNVSAISGATAFFGTSTPTVQQVVDAVENRWTGKLTTNRSDWKWNLTNAQKDMLIKVISGINEGTLVMSSGCP